MGRPRLVRVAQATALLVACFSLFACAPTSSLDGTRPTPHTVATSSVGGATKPLVVRRDLGGSLYARLQEVAALQKTKTPVEIRGACGSACTLYLAMDTACVHPRARFLFHGALYPPDKARANGVTPEQAAHAVAIWNTIMAAAYPPALESWFLREAAHLQDDAYKALTGSQVIAMGARACST